MPDEIMKMKWVGNTIQMQYISPDDLEDICTMLEKESVSRYLFFLDRTHMKLPGHIFLHSSNPFQRSYQNIRDPLLRYSLFVQRIPGSLQDNVDYYLSNFVLERT